METFASEIKKAKKISSESVTIIENLITMCNSEKLYNDFDRVLFKKMLENVLKNEGVK